MHGKGKIQVSDNAFYAYGKLYIANVIKKQWQIIQIIMKIYLKELDPNVPP